MEITYVQGGMREFEKTGVYPEYLTFRLPAIGKRWQRKVRTTPQEGTLKHLGELLYYYKFDGDLCWIRRADEAVWSPPDVMLMEMRD